MSKFEPPMGISQWHKHGEKYGYSEYWKADIERQARIEELTYLLEDAQISCSIDQQFISDRLAELEREE